MKTEGTGGVSDVEEYLLSRFDLHRKIVMSHINQNADELFEALDSGNIDNFLSYFHEDATFKFGSQNSVKGRDNIREYTAAFLATVNSMKHKIDHSFCIKDTLIIQGSVLYNMKNGKTQSIPYCDILKVDLEGKIKDYCIYCDPRDLF